MSSVYNPKNGYEAFELFENRKKLSAPELKDLRKHLKLHPDDLEGRLRIMAHLQFPKRKSEWDELVRHYIWFIENYPDHPTHLCLMFPWKEGSHYEEVSRCWKRLLRAFPDNGNVICNAGDFYKLIEPDLALKTLKKAVKLQPFEIRTLELYYRTARMQFGFAETSGKEALAAGKNLFAELKNEFHKASVAWTLMKLCAWMNKDAQCKKMAEYVLKHHPEKDVLNPTAIHLANFYLGWCAFRAGDISGFKNFLSQANQVMFKYGTIPFTIIFRDLTHKSVRGIVLDYLQTCVDNGCGQNTEWFTKKFKGGSKLNIEQQIVFELLEDDFFHWILEY